MAARLRQFLPVAWLVGLTAALQFAAGPSALGTTAALAALVACALLTIAVSLASMSHVMIAAPEPAMSRLRGRFQSQTRPGVPGRVRARAPGR